MYIRTRISIPTQMIKGIKVMWMAGSISPQQIEPETIHSVQKRIENDRGSDGSFRLGHSGSLGMCTNFFQDYSESSSRMIGDLQNGYCGERKCIKRDQLLLYYCCGSDRWLREMGGIETVSAHCSHCAYHERLQSNIAQTTCKC